MIGRSAGARLITATLSAVMAALMIAGCAAYSGTPSQQVSEWVKQNSFFADTDLLVADVIRIDKALKIGTAKQLRTICGGFASDIGTANTTLPTPDLTLTNDLNDAETRFLDAATSCSGVGSVSSPTMKADIVKIHQALGYLRRAQKRLATFGVTWKIRL